MSCCYDYEPAFIHVEEDFIARKHYTCDSCKADVAPGDRYGRVRSLYDGCWSMWKLCEECFDLYPSLADVMCISPDETCFAYREYLREYTNLAVPNWPVNSLTVDEIAWYIGEMSHSESP